MLWYQKLFPNEGSNSRKVFNLFYTHLLSVYVLGGRGYIPWCMCVVITGQPAGTVLSLNCVSSRNCQA